MKYVFDRDDLERSGTSLHFIGSKLGADRLSLILIDGEAGSGANGEFITEWLDE